MTSTSCLMVIFGASGDLTKRKLIPALCNLAQAKLLPPQFAVVGFSSSGLTTATFRDQLAQDFQTYATNPIDPDVRESLLNRTYYVQGDFQNAAAYERLKAQIDEARIEHDIAPNRFFYLAVAPALFSEIVRQLGAAGLTREENGSWSRVIIEKPFGRDLQSARQLNRDITQVLDERQIYRIDHYLGK